MQTRPANWEKLLYDLNHKTEYRYVINGVEYTGDYVQGVPVIDKPMMLQPVIGRCCTGTFTITVRKDINIPIPKAAPVSVFCRLVSDDGLTVTDWIPQGRFWITKRSGYGNLVTLTCRDNMILAGRSYTDKTKIIEWPAAMVDVFEEIVALMNVEVDPRTVIHSGPMYMVDYPNEDMLMSEILSMIAAAHGGNFIMSESGKLRLVPLPDTETPRFKLDGSFTDYTPYSYGAKTISRVTITDDADNIFTNGDDTGIELTGVCNYCTQRLVDSIAGGAYIKNGTLYASGAISKGRATITEAQGSFAKSTVSLFASGVIGKTYTAYRINGAYFDPCIELGDTFSAVYLGANLNLIANSITVNCTQGYYCELENGVPDDDEEEIPYVSPAELQAKRYVSTGHSYFGNRINRSEGFVSEYMVDDVAVARMIANSNLFTMQRKVNGNWENVLYFNPVDMQYHFTGEVKIDTTKFAASTAVVDNPSIVLTADEKGLVAASTRTVNVIAYTGDTATVPTVSSVSGLPAGMTAKIGTADTRKRVPITLTVAAGSNLGSADSINGTFTVKVTSPVELDISVNWAKVNTGPEGIDGTSGYNTASVALYQRSATQPSAPTAAVTYNFSTGKVSGSVGNWQQSIPAGTDPCYATFALITSRDTSVSIAASTWTTPSIVVQDGKNGQDGDAGYSAAMIHIYKRSEQAPATPSKACSFVFVTSTISGDIAGWTQDIPGTDGNPCWVSSAYVSSQTSVVSVPATAWSSPVKMVEDGERGSRTFSQDEPPTEAEIGDLWVDTDDDNKLYRYGENGWESIQDLNIPDIIQQLVAAQTSLQVLNSSIEGTVNATYVTNQIEAIVEQFNSALKLQAEDLQLSFEGTAQNAAGEVRSQFSTLIRASGTGVEIGKSDSNFKVQITNERLSFLQMIGGSAVEVAYMSNNKLFISEAQITNSLAFGADGGNRFVWTKTSTGLSLRYVSA